MSRIVLQKVNKKLENKRQFLQQYESMYRSDPWFNSLRNEEDSGQDQVADHDSNYQPPASLAA